ncbi:M14 family metallopeptidase [Polaribacter sp. Q13]|uniref:M14 family metallopeptidase n=1 Tax=Polaribacter sp. Q13 TaxID=2806551 RepID=UPI00193B2C18|nr:M14 family metallopeptidase [Polaribacter sp. Q13]QVY67196.1 M14 family metallopeptidase [Polaribacter sp. Q13]
MYKIFKTILFFTVLWLLFSCDNSSNKNKDFTTLFEKLEGTETPEYKEVISYYKELADEYASVSLFSFGQTDSGEPLHLVVYNREGVFNVDEIKESPKNRILINNGIHPGESDGIDASMLLLRDLVQNDSLIEKYKNTIICVIPVYNVGGALNRNSHTRANQNGPKEYGFRGNARNYDLNRDFIKQDTKNAAAFAEIFHAVNPDVFIDNHVSNGADYQYAITHLFTQHNKLGGGLGTFIETKMRPSLENLLLKKGISITPYVNVWGTTPEDGWSQFFDSPRYSTGYTTLFNTLGLMVETHMLKPYKLRVAQTYQLLFSALDFTEENSAEIKELRANAMAEVLANKTYPIAFKVDTKKPTELQFKGYQGEYIDSKATTGKRLFYDRTKPYTKSVKYYNNFETTKSVAIPKAYILQKGWHKIIDRLKNNQIKFIRFKNDTTIEVEVNHIAEFETRKTAYEGHYLHYNTTVNLSTENFQFRKGDIYIPTHQNGVRYLLETLEAAATDSFFNWNFFDTVLQQKEGYSAYVFEDIAAQFLIDNPSVKKEFEEKLKSDTEFAKNPREQLNYIYKKSPYYEPVHLRLPIFKTF